MAKNNTLEKRIKTLQRHGSYDEKVNLIWGWLTSTPMTLKQFKRYLKEARNPQRINEDPESIMG